MFYDTDQDYRWGVEDANELMATVAPTALTARWAYAEGLLKGIFANAPADCEEIRIGMRRWFAGVAGQDTFILTDWLHVGGGRVRTRIEERVNQVEVTQAMIDAACKPAGWAMGRPSRRNTTEFMYSFTRAELDQHEYRLDSRTVQTVERHLHEAALTPNWA